MTGTHEASSDTTRTVPRWQRMLCAVLVVIVCVLTPVSVLAVWTRNTLLDTNQYVETVGPLAKDAAIQDAVANRVARTLQSQVDLEQEIEDALPNRAAFLAPILAQGVETFARDATLRLMETEQFQNLWNEINRRAHTQVVAVLTGEGGTRIATEDGQVVVRLGPIVEEVRERLENLGIDIFDQNGGGQRVSRQLVLFQSDELTKIQGAVDLLEDVAYWLPILLLVMLAIAIAISPNRRRTVLRTAIWIAVGMALLLLLFNLGRTFYLDAVTSAGADRDAAAAAYDQILSFLRLSTRTLFAVAVIVAIGAWLAGPGPLATRIRERARTIAQGGGRAADFEPAPLAHFVARYRRALRVLVIGVALVVLIALNRVTPLTVLVVAALVLVGLLLIEFLAYGVPADAEGPPGGPPTDGGPSGPAGPPPTAPRRPAPMPSATGPKRSG